MEQVHTEIVRLATELESVKCQVQTKCNALRDLFARTTATMAGSQHDGRLNHEEAERHLPQQVGGSRVDYGDFAFRMEGIAAVLSRDGQGGALLREVAKLDKFKSDTNGALEMTFGMSNNWTQPWQPLWSRVAAEKWQHWSGGSLAWTLETDFMLGMRSRSGWNRLRRRRDSYRPSAPGT